MTHWNLMMNRKSKPTLIFALAILMLAVLACAIGPSGSNDTNDSTENQIVITAERVNNSAAAETAGSSAETSFNPAIISSGVFDIEQRLIDLYKQVNPSVVHILVYTGQSDPIPLGSGSGFVYDSTGRIVTNNHVVEDGAEFEVIFADGNRRRATVIGRDVDSDLAIIQADNLPEGADPIALGDSENLQVGQLVIAIGNPFGEQGSMSLGIISGLGRSLESQRQLDTSTGRYSLPEVIQTDAPINPGNSGGPLINLAGEVVGVNSAIRSTTGVNSGVGFSIPVNAVRRIIPALIENGEYIYSYMGVQIQSLNLNLQERFNLDQPSGAYVTSLTSGGPAEAAGLIPADEISGTGGDLIIAIDGEPIRDTEELIAFLVFHTEVGQTIDLTIIRNGETITVPLTLGARP